MPTDKNEQNTRRGLPERPLVNCGRPLPPLVTRWKQGQSGNPKGRPKKEDSIIDMLEELTNTLCPTDSEKRSYAELLVRTLVHQGLKGNLGAIKEILNRLAGRVPFPIERINSAPSPSNEKTSRDCNSLPPARRAEITREMKEDICQFFGWKPFEGELVQK